MANDNPLLSTFRNAVDWRILAGSVYEPPKKSYLVGVIFDDGSHAEDVQMATPIFNATDGSGMYNKPVAGARVLVALHPGGKKYIIGFIPNVIKPDPETNEIDHTNSRKDLNHGDISIGTPYGNTIIIRNAGEGIQIRNGPGNEIVLSSVGNECYVACQRLTVKTDAGIMEQYADQYGNACSSFLFQKNIEDDSNFVKIDIGSIRDKEISFESAEAGSEDDPDFISEEHTDFPSSPEVIFSMNVCNKLRITADIEGNIRVQGNKAAKAIFKDFIYTESKEGDIDTVAKKGKIIDKAKKIINHLRYQDS